MTDPSAMVWSLRLQETEVLLEKRKATLAAQQATRLELEQALAAEEGRADEAVHDLALLREASQSLTASRVQLSQELVTARGGLADALDCGRLAAQKQALQRQLAHLTSLAESEQHMQQAYSDACGDHFQEQGSRGRGLQLRAETARERRVELLQVAKQLDSQQAALVGKLAALQDKLQQLSSVLTDTKQANACMRARVEAATSNTAAELQSAQERLAMVKRQAFQLSRQHAVDAARLQQLQDEMTRCRQQSRELEALSGRAAMTIDQLASSCEL